MSSTEVVSKVLYPIQVPPMLSTLLCSYSKGSVSPNSPIPRNLTLCFHSSFIEYSLLKVSTTLRKAFSLHCLYEQCLSTRIPFGGRSLLFPEKIARTLIAMNNLLFKWNPTPAYMGNVFNPYHLNNKTTPLRKCTQESLLKNKRELFYETNLCYISIVYIYKHGCYIFI